MSYRQPFKGDYPITQKYGALIPGVTYNGSPHTGIDYGCPEGTEILASAAGTVMIAGMSTSGYGKYVIIRHEDGKATLYAHLSEICTKMNFRVLQGDKIGLSGSTGYATGPHLHFEARKKWNDYTSHFDPMELPLMNFADATSGSPEGTSQKPDPTSQNLKGAEAFQPGDLLKVQNDLGVKAFTDLSFSYERVGYYQKGTKFFYTGDSAIRKDNGLTYMRVIPTGFSVWIAVNDGETQLLDK